MSNTIICPISTEKIDSNVSRLSVFITAIFMILYLITLNPVYMAIATFDTMIRGVWDVKYSPVRMMSLRIVQVTKLKPKKINLDKKIFASRLGMLCGIISLILYYFNLEVASLIVAGMWMALAILDSVVDFCLGCIIYSYVVYPFYKGR